MNWYLHPNECGLLPNGEPSSENINDFYNFAYFIYNKSIEFIEDKEILSQDMLNSDEND